MNQILDYDDNNNENNGKAKANKKSNNINYNNNNGYNNNNLNNYKSQKNSGGGYNKTPISDKIIKVFAFLLILIAIALITSGVLSMLKNREDNKVSKNPSSPNSNNPTATAEITAELDDETGEVTIKVENTMAISKMIYSWDQEHDNVVSGEKQTSIEKEVLAPHGEHVLHVQVTDEENNKTLKDFTFNSETGIDVTNPTITLEVENGKLIIRAEDDTSIAFVTYTWNEGEEVKMVPENENQKEYEFEIDIPKGKNTIVVAAVDGSESSNAKTTSKVLTGVLKPEINYAFINGDASVLQIICTHENGIKSIYYTLNGQEYQWEVAEGEEAPTELSFTQASVNGHNEMNITVTSVDDTVTEFNPAWEYEAPESATSTEENTSTESSETTNN